MRFDSISIYESAQHSTPSANLRVVFGLQSFSTCVQLEKHLFLELDIHAVRKYAICFLPRNPCNLCFRFPLY